MPPILSYSLQLLPVLLLLDEGEARQALKKTELAISLSAIALVVISHSI
jgi:hypothetical protein